MLNWAYKRMPKQRILRTILKHLPEELSNRKAYSRKVTSCMHLNSLKNRNSGSIKLGYIQLHHKLILLLFCIRVDRIDIQQFNNITQPLYPLF